MKSKSQACHDKNEDDADDDDDADVSITKVSQKMILNQNLFSNNIFGMLIEVLDRLFRTFFFISYKFI